MHPGVVEVVAAQVRDAGHHPALQQGEADEVGGQGHGERGQAAEVGDEALRAGVADVVLDHLVHGAVDVAALLGELLVGRLGGGRQRADPVEGALERLVDELRGEPRRELVRLRREPSPDLLADPHATPSGACLLMPTLASGTQPGRCSRAQ